MLYQKVVKVPGQPARASARATAVLLSYVRMHSVYLTSELLTYVHIRDLARRSKHLWFSCILMSTSIEMTRGSRVGHPSMTLQPEPCTHISDFRFHDQYRARTLNCPSHGELARFTRASHKY